MVKNLFIKNECQKTPLEYKVFNWALVLIVIVLFFVFSFNQLNYTFIWANLWDYRFSFLSGLTVTLVISFVGLFLSTLLGVIFGLGQSSKIMIFRYFSRFFVEIIRGTPLLVQVLIFFYVVANALGINNRFAVGILTMSIFSGAYIAEIVRAGVENVGASQIESAKSLGLTTWQSYRYVIFPQVLTQSLPPLAGQFASLVKDSSLLSIIAIKEFTMAAREMNANTFSTLEAYLPLAIGYLILTIPISSLTRYLEKKFKYET